MNPPVDAPTSSASRPVTSRPKCSRAWASLMPPRPTNGWSGVFSSTRACAVTGAPAFDTTCPSTITCPARISARARSRDGASARATRTRSRRAGFSAFLLTTSAACGRPPSPHSRQPAVGEAALVERCLGSVQAVGRHRARALESEERGVRRLVALCVFARSLAECGRFALDIKDVVDDLERQPDLLGVPPDRGDARLRRLHP